MGGLRTSIVPLAQRDRGADPQIVYDAIPGRAITSARLRVRAPSDDRKVVLGDSRHS